ncbi:S8 family serine peptidase [Lacibacter sp. H375]|uniref:S8 family serine peptidase n=1 Tax=Lacibacter sp. H375 TaxID=3133424 RepID=UPI0030C11D8C
MNETTAVTCPLCGDEVHKLIYRFHLESERLIIDKIKEQFPDWAIDDGICSRCIDYYHTELLMQQRMLPEIGPHFPVKSLDDFIILPSALRIDTDVRFTGKGVTICFIDSGFYLHDDLVKTRSRIKKIIDITHPDNTEDFFSKPHSSAWHGTMTSVVCAGDGYCSNGLYKGIAPDAELVLIKVQDDDGRIPTANIMKALEWVAANHLTYDIKIVNLSVSADENLSYHESGIDQLAEQLINAGVNIVAAAGNNTEVMIKPPANAPNVISIGGVDDANDLTAVPFSYHSSFGTTIDGLYKPELVANAIWIAAPILPCTNEAEEAAALHDALQLSDKELMVQWPDVQKKSSLPENGNEKMSVTYYRQLLANRVMQTKFFSRHYMHVDGTSFAAPLVTGVIAQLLQAKPELDPLNIRRLLFSTAKRLPDVPVVKQGYGYIRPRRALLNILNREVVMKQHASPFINRPKKMIEFHIQNSCAHQISLAGSFNYWAQDVLLMEPSANGFWKIEIPMPPQGTYTYKFLIDDKMWVEDVENPVREPDGFNGWNSVLNI